MAEILTINNKQVLIDLAEELSDYNFGYNARWTADKLISSSPFRDDKAPSFFVNLSGEYAGTWGDSGALDDEYSRGDFVKLIALLNGITYEDAADYLIDKYGVLHEIKEGEPIRIHSPELRHKDAINTLSDDVITYAVSPYLIRRGIGEVVQRLYGVGYNVNHKGYTAIAWRYNGALRAVKYRSTKGRGFYYARGGTPVSRLIYGLDYAEEDTVIVEGEIDAMSWRQAGFAAVAVAGAHLSRHQVDLLRRSRIKRLYLGGDNDEQGRMLNEQIRDKMGGYVDIYEVDYGNEKDANDVLLRQGVRGLAEVYASCRHVRTINLRV